MKHIVTRFEKNLYEWDFWTADVLKDFRDWLRQHGENRADSKSKEFQDSLMIAFAYSYHRMLFNAIDRKGFKY